MQEIEISSLKEFIEVIESLPPNFSLSRGQAKNYCLLPSALRKDNRGNRIYSNSTIKYFFDEFKNNSVRYIDNLYSVENEYEWSLYAQHFGVPTKLLDFSYSHLVSLFFAIENAFKFDESEDDYAVVWFLDPLALNTHSCNRKEIINISSADCPQLETKDYPIAVCGKKNNNRIDSQNGLFVYFQNDSEALENLKYSDEILKKVIIPYRYARKILSTLYFTGIRLINIYPELSSISKDILLKYEIQRYLTEEGGNEEDVTGY